MGKIRQNLERSDRPEVTWIMGDRAEIPTWVSLDIQDCLVSPATPASTRVYHNHESTSVPPSLLGLPWSPCCSSLDSDLDCKSGEGYQVSVRHNYHLVRAKARAQGHILVRTALRGSCRCLGPAMRRVRLCEPGSRPCTM